MKRLFIVFLCLLIFPIYANAEKIAENLDGNDWTTMTAIMKTTFIAGVVAGSNSIIKTNLYNLGIRAITDKIDCDSPKAKKMFLEYMNFYNKSKKNAFSRNDIDLVLCENHNYLKGFGFYGVTVGQLVEGVDSLYSDFKNKRIKIIEALGVVKEQINGESPEETEKLIQQLRSYNNPYKN
jgi:hypothetical protein